MFKAIEVVRYDPNWPSILEAEASLIKQAMADSRIAIRHVGSTSVPDLAAKPKIYIIAVVQDLFFDKSQPAVSTFFNYFGYFYDKGGG